jgi:hypothetical protein
MPSNSRRANDRHSSGSVKRWIASRNLSLQRSMTKLSRSRGAVAPEFLMYGHVKRESQEENENRGVVASVSVFATPVSPILKPVIASVSEAIQF